MSLWNVTFWSWSVWLNGLNNSPASWKNSNSNKRRRTRRGLPSNWPVKKITYGRNNSNSNSNCASYWPSSRNLPRLFKSRRSVNWSKPPSNCVNWHATSRP